MLNRKRKVGIILAIVVTVLISLQFIWFPLSIIDGTTYYPKLVVYIDAYAVSSPNSTVNLARPQIESILSQTNQIWGPYGVEFQLGEVRPLNVSDELASIGSVSGIAERDAKALALSAGSYTQDKTVDVFFVERFVTRGGSDEGVALNDGNISAAFVAMKTLSGRIGWNLAHELGHALNLRHSGVNNLMVDGSCWAKPFFPSTLRREQVQAIRSKIEGKDHTVAAPQARISRFDTMPGWLPCLPIAETTLVLAGVLAVFGGRKIGQELAKKLKRHRVFVPHNMF